MPGLRCFIVAGLTAAGMCVAGAAQRNLDFANDKLDAPPAAFRSTLVGAGRPGQWKVMLDDIVPTGTVLSTEPTFGGKQRVLAQVSRDPTDERFPMLILDDEVFGDFTVTAKLKVVGGAIEQMAGIAFRLQDEKGYYAARIDALANTFRFYRVVGGVRDQAIGTNLVVAPNVWHELGLECKGNRIRFRLNGNDVLPEITDSTFIRGKLGFWTKSDSVSYFRDIRLTYTPHEYLARLLVRDTLKRYPRLLGLKIFAASPDKPGVRIVASDDENELGQPAGKVEEDVIAKDAMFYGRGKGQALITLPLHDRNGVAIAAVRVVLKPMIGQTEQNAIGRALPIIKLMEPRVPSLKDLLD
jgi:hypothetical protein